MHTVSFSTPSWLNLIGTPDPRPARTLTLCATLALFPACSPGADDPMLAVQETFELPPAREPSAHLGVEPALQELLDAGDADEEVEVELRVDVPRFRAAELPSMVASIEVSDGAPRYTLDGRPVDAAALEVRATADRRAINADLARQFAERRRHVDQAIRDAGVEGAVRERGDSWFRVALPRARAQAMLRALDGRFTWARLPTLAVATVDLRNNLHDQDGNTNPLDDGEDGALERIGVIDFAHAYNHRGQGIGIWHNEGYAPYPNRPEFADADLRDVTGAHWQPVQDGGSCRHNDECCSGMCTGLIGYKTCTSPFPCACGVDEDNLCMGDIRSQEHSTLVALIAHETAPDATIYHTATSATDCMISGFIDAQASPPVYVGAQSWSYEGGGATNNAYNVLGHCNAEWDDYIRTSRIAHFHSSGNSNANFVGSPARAYNVIGVGNYEHVSDTMLVESGYMNPNTGVEKPEIVAPGTGITAAPGWSRVGSSISSPMAAGFAADLMSGSAFFRNQPQAIKAYLIAGAHNVDGGSGLGGYLGLAGAHDGAGRLDYLDTYFYRWGKVYNGANADFFDAQEKIVETRSLEAGKRYTIAIAWLADGEWAYTHANGQPGDEPLDMKMKLTVARAGVGTYTGYVSRNNFQLVDLTVPANGAGAWTITIERMYNAGVGGVNLALTVGEHS
ncbi:S8 family serine peptidase [Nannocystis sp. SCPEA4]|uniref:S8 family serine peptidase n=1 Tax=Nannocystis sp. SCPEA4 TaxID=2996787 RepID=UPI0022705BCA|nr:S8 family serine peptidase [Nannocystis sp. SCPEA4]MCY1059932.1 S8 family serine peptidase [Nannocystis sp. SCPEA4]